VFTKSRIVLNIHDALSNLAVSFTDLERLLLDDSCDARRDSLNA
jgi:hypothetical protein